MINIFKAAIFAFAFLGLAFGASAQVSAVATASATILAPLAMEKKADINFGNVSVSQVAGTVILAPEGTRSATAGVSLPSAAGSVAAAEFTVSGAKGFAFAISLPSTDHVLTSADANAPALVINNFTSSAPTGTLTDGTATIKVGATLHVQANQAAGNYTNSEGFNVTVNYN